MMKKGLLFLMVTLLVLARTLVLADEGMWMPMLLAQNYEAMQRLGLKLTPEELYSINHSSVKDAIVHFGSGCTAEVISEKGLVLTNHHCGFDAISKVSTVGNNILLNGYMAGSQAEEIPCPGLSVKFLIRIEDVSTEVKNAIGKASGKALETKFEEIAKSITKKANEDHVYESEVKSFYAGNQYFLFVYQKFTDIRLVATPPECLGKFGGDTDNWMWPRHTCDFSMFRIYCNNDNKPAPYSLNNRPYIPVHHLPVSLKGVHENDFALIMGYPGRTTRYLTSYGIDLATHVSNPSLVKIRDKRLAIMRTEMDKDMAVELQYASAYARLANYWKYFMGQTEQLKNLHVFEKKQGEEDAFRQWADENDHDLSDLMTEYQKAYAAYSPYARHATYYTEAFMAPALTRMGAACEAAEKALKQGLAEDSLQGICKRLMQTRRSLLNDISVPLDKKVFAALNQLYYEDIPKSQHPSFFNEMFEQYGSEHLETTFAHVAEDMYTQTVLLDSDKFNAWCTPEHLSDLLKDPAVRYALAGVHNYKDHYEANVNNFTYTLMDLNRDYQGALMRMHPEKQMYPDANSTMRATYGRVCAYQPKDAVAFNYYTTADGLLEKYQPESREFNLPAHVVDLIKKHDFGDYEDATQHNLMTCFITNNDITGGNSGSPVMNGEGELIGCAFDGNWEAMSGDVAFDTRFKRTICADIRYILWVTDKVLNGRRLLDEMTLHH